MCVRSSLRRALLLVCLGFSAELSAADPRPVAAPTAALASTSEQEARKWREPAESLKEQGKYKEALPLAQDVLARTEKACGPESIETARALGLLGALKRETAAYPDALPLLERAATLLAARTGPESEETLAARNGLAMLHYRADRDAVAEKIWREIMEVRVRTKGAESYEARIVGGKVGLARHGVGDYPEAERLIRRALAAEEEKSGPDSLETALLLGNIANIYSDLGDNNRAEPLNRRTLAIVERIQGPNHPDTGNNLHNLARNLMQLLKLDEAEKLYGQSIEVYTKTVGENDPRTLRARSNLGTLQIIKGDLRAALPVFEEVYRQRSKTIGAESEMAAFVRTQVAGCRLRLNEKDPRVLEEVEKELREIIAVHERLKTDTRRYALSALEALSSVLKLRGKSDEAVAFSRRAEAAREGMIAQVLSFAPEIQRLEYIARRDHLALAAWLGDAGQVAEIALRIKGTVLDSLLEDQRAKAVAPRGELRPVAATQAAPGGIGGKEESPRFALTRRALATKVEDVQAALPKKGALVEFVRFREDPLCNLVGNQDAQKTFRYGAVVLTPGRAPTFVSLDRESELEPLLRAMQQGLRDPKSDPLALEAALRKVSRAVWQPVAAALPEGTEEIVISPEGALNFVSFAVLPLQGSDRFVGEQFRVRYVASGRDLLVPPAPADRVSDAPRREPTLVAFANPDLLPATALKDPAKGVAAAATLRAIDPAEFRALDLGPLPGTEAESRAVLDYAKRQGWQGQGFTGANATEAALFAVHGPRVLHLATHGFFLPYLGDWRSPMQRSGLALCGAAATIAAWERGETPPAEGDGIVTAEEVTRLDLRGTWLAVLSACDTGLGETRLGEGVFGLRRGFVLAGAQHLLMTLWPVNDAETSRTMLDFYAAAERGGDPARALAETQRARLGAVRRERGIAVAARLVGPFIMSSQAR